MDAYPAELTSPPVPLAALVGRADRVRPLADYLRSQHAPRMHSIGVEDAHSVAGTFGVRKAAPSAAPPAGILKAGWLRKQRTQRPAVAALLVEREAVVGDPSAWAWLVSQLDAVKAAVKSRGARIVVLVALPQGVPEVPEDRLSMICRQAGTDRRSVVCYSPSDSQPAMQVVGRLLHEQAAAFYAADAQRRLAAHAHRNVPSLDLSLRTAFKLGALAEFRSDWAAALRMYGEAAGYIPQLLAAAGGAQPQRYAEVRAVAEQMHIKVTSLLLLALNQVPEALAQFESHRRLFRRLPFQAQPGLLASHHGWLCRQHTAMAQLLLSCGADLAGLKREHQPGQLYLAAAKAAIERRKVASFIGGMHGGRCPVPPGRVEPGLFVGQFLLLPADPAVAALLAGSAAVAAAAAGVPVAAAAAAAGAGRRLTDEQFELALEAEECGVEHSKATLELLRTAQEALQGSGRLAAKTLQHALLLLGHELLETGDTPGAERLLTDVTACYRRERWEGPLAAALLLLRECRQQQGDLEAHTQLTLEVSALEGAALDAEQRAAMATAAVAVLVPEPASPAAAASLTPGGVGGAAVAAQQQQQQQQQQQGMRYTVASHDSGWLTVLPLSAGFFDPLRPSSGSNGGGAIISGGSSGGSDATVQFGAAIWSNAPVDLPLAVAELSLTDALGSFTAPLLLARSSTGIGGSSGGAALVQQAAEAAATAQDLVLPPGGWLRLVAAIPVRCSGELQANSVVLRFGDGDTAHGGTACSTITYQLAALMPDGGRAPPPLSPRSARAAGGAAAQAPTSAVGWLRGSWGAMLPPFSRLAGYLPGRCCVEVPPQHAPPLLALAAPEVLLQGEQAAVMVTLAAAGDALQGAVLRARALHTDSQQPLGLVPSGGAASTAEQLSLPEAPPAGGCHVALGDVTAGERRQVTLLLDARYRGGAEVAVELTYTAAARGGSAPEAGHCSASLSLQVQLPWRLGVQLLGPPATHTLLAGSPAGPVTTAGAAAPGSADSELQEQQRRLAGLSTQDSGASPQQAQQAAAAFASELVAGEGRDLSVLLLRSLPPRLVLPAGQRCTALVHLQCQAGCQLDVVGVELEAAAGATATAATPAGGAVPGAADGSAAPADTLNKSDVFCAAFTLGSDGADVAELPSLGFLRLRWRRHRHRPPLLAAAARGGSTLGEADAKAALDDAAISGGGGGGAAAAAAMAAPLCEVLVPLPPVAFLPPLLTASLSFPPAATAGQPMSMQLCLANASAACQEVAVSVGDPHGFLLAGPKSTRLQLLPRSTDSVSWQAVPYHTGLLRLPEVTVTCAQHGQVVEATRGCAVFVDRPPEQTEGAEAAAAAADPAAAAVARQPLPEVSLI